jgi:hypothetical protein
LLQVVVKRQRICSLQVAVAFGLVPPQKMHASEKPQQPDRDKVKGDDVIQHARNQQDKYAGDEGNYRYEADVNIHVMEFLRVV